MNDPMNTAPVLETAGISYWRRTMAAVGAGLVCVGTLGVAASPQETASVVAYDCRDLDPIPTKGGPDSMPSPAAPGSVCPRAEGVVTFVYIHGLEPAGYQPVTEDEYQEAADIALSDLSTATDGAIRLTAQVVDAPAAVTDEVRATMDPRGECINPDGYFSTDEIVSRQMGEQLRNSRLIVAAGGMSCWDQGTRLLGNAPEFGDSRMVALYSAEMGGQPETVEDLAKLILHEVGHKYNLGHVTYLLCDKGFDPFLAVRDTLDLNAAFGVLDDPEHCKHKEYRPNAPTIMADSNTLTIPGDMAITAHAQDLLTSQQADFVSDRLPSVTGARTALLDKPCNQTLVTRQFAEANEQYGALLPLDEPIIYDDATYANVLFDYSGYKKKHGESVSYVDVYLTTGDGEEVLKTIFMGRMTILNEGVTVTYNDRTIVFRTSQPNMLSVELTEGQTKVPGR